jgi:glycosyltransferase involved in cell wall biosynthesis
LLEGFGLPAIEAAACGCPVLATTASPLPTLLGDGGRFVDPLDSAGWERALIEVLHSEELRQRMRDAGLAAARRLTWDLAAQQLQTVLRKVVA